MKFQNAILSLATATLSGTNVVDAKIWTLRGLGKANNNNINEVTSNNSNEVVVNNHSESLVEELPSPTANLRELFLTDEEQGERRLPGKKNKKKDKGEEKKDDDEAEGASEKKKKDKKKKDDEAEGKDGDKKGKDEKKGRKDQKVGWEIYADAPSDVAENAGCDDIVDIVPVSDQDARRVLSNGSRRRAKAGDGKDHAKTFSTKGNKDDLASGRCSSFVSDGSLEKAEIAASGVDVPVEGRPGNCDPDAEECEADEVGPDPTEEEGGEEDVKVNEDKEASRQLLEGRRLTGNTNHIGEFAPLSCNPVEFDCTGAAGLSTLVGGGPVVVPCGSCYVVSAMLYWGSV